MPVHNPQVVPLNQLHPHLIGQKAVFKISRIVDAGRQDRDTGPAFAIGRRRGLERGTQVLGIIADAFDLLLTEQFGKHLQHRFPVF